jgi:putative membrane protein
MAAAGAEALAAAVHQGAGDMALDVMQADVGAVEAEIKAQEVHTAGEIVVVIASQCDDYIHVPIHIATACALAVPLVMPLFQFLFPWSSVPWRWIFVVQLLVFIAVAALLSLDRLRWWVTPRSMKRKYAGRFAAAEFLALDLHRTMRRTGVLIFVALREHYVEIIADKAAGEKISGTEWQGVVRDMLPFLRKEQLTESLLAGTRGAGELLAREFPPRGRNPNEIPDRVVIVDDRGTRIVRPGGHWDAGD